MCQKKSLIFFRYAGFQARLFDNSGFDTIDLYKRFPVLLMVMWFWVGVLMALWDWVLCYRRILLERHYVENLSCSILVPKQE